MCTSWNNLADSVGSDSVSRAGSQRVMNTTVLSETKVAKVRVAFGFEGSSSPAPQTKHDL